MNIGFDIDGVLTNIGDFQIKYGEKYFNRKATNPNGFTISEMFECSKAEEHKFWEKNLLKYSITEPARKEVAETIKKLHNDGNKIYIITSREFTDKDNFLGKVMRTIVEEWLKANNIQYDDIVYCSDDKSEALKDNYISVMVEDNVNNINQLSKEADIICVDCKYNQNITKRRTHRVENMGDELYNCINDIKFKNEKNIKDPIKPLSGKISIDKPYIKYYSELQTKINNPEMSIYEYLLKCNKNNMNNKAITYYNTNITFKEFFKKIDECAEALKQQGVQKNDIVTVCMPNTPEGVIAFYAINKIGAVANMIHPLSSENEIKDYLNEVKSKVMIMVDICGEKVDKILDETIVEKVIVSSPKDSMNLLMKAGYTYLTRKSKYNIPKDKKHMSWNEFMKLSKPVEKSKSIYQPNSLAVLLHTGGSTGTPKGVMISNESFNTNVEQLKFTIPTYNDGDSLLAITPIFHGFGLANCVHTALCTNMSINLLPRFDSKTFTKTLLRDKPNLILGVPTLWDSMLKNKDFDGKDLSFLKVLISGGDNLPVNLENKLNEFLKQHNAPNKVFKGYGMTECLAAASFSQPEANKLSSVGIALPQNNYKIVDKDTYEEKAPNEEGEICISGPSIMMGYYNNEKETNDTIKKHADGKTWLHTGDIGYITETGELYYTQRIKRIIISSGYNIYPSKIEEIIKQHPAVENCIVIGVPHPYKVNVPKAYVVLKNEYQNNKEVLEEIKKLCNDNLSKFSLPKQYEQIDELPKTKMGKVDYRLLEKENSDKYFEEQKNASEKTLQKSIKR